MPEPVKTTRRYDSRRRREQAARTRRDIIDAAHEVFVARGYNGATMAGVAKAAGVAVETVYRAVGAKAALFQAVVEAAVAGGAGRSEKPPEERPAIRAVIEEQDPRRQLQRYAATQPGIHARIGPLVRVLKSAAEAEPSLAVAWEQLEGERLAGMGRFAQLLADRGSLRSDLSAEEARDVLWTLNSHEVYEKLVEHQGWTPERYERWLADTLAASLLPLRTEGTGA